MVHDENYTRLLVVKHFFTCVLAILALLDLSRTMVVVLAPH